MFDVTPEELEQSATRIDEKTKEFTNTYKSIYTAVQDLRVSYKGEASDAFNEKIESYQNDFTAAEAALQRYTQFLRDYATKIRNVENDAAGKASSLSSGQ